MGAPVHPGQLIKGKYRIDRVLGEGGMGVVVAAHHLALDQRVAIKFLHAALLAVPAVVERFAREARAASKIESDHVARVTDVDQLEDGTPFMVMEYLDGRDLSVVREHGQGLPVPAAVGYVLEACEAIGEAHRRGIIHRDIKPANLFLAARPEGRARVKVLDFGISKFDAGDRVSPAVTKTATVMGSAEYMSPEQMLSARDVDARTDIWALGVTLYELLTAQVPYTGETVTQIYARMMAAPPQPPSALRPDVPPGLDRAVLRCLERDRAQRYASVEELRAALAPYATPDAVQPLPAWMSVSSAGREGASPPLADSNAETQIFRPGVPQGTPGTVYAPAAPVGTLAGATTLVATLRKRPGRSFAIVAGAVVTATGIGVAVVASLRGFSNAPGVTVDSAAPASVAPVEPSVTPGPPVSGSPTVPAAPATAPSGIDVRDLPDAPGTAPRPTAAPKPTAGALGNCGCAAADRSCALKCSAGKPASAPKPSPPSPPRSHPDKPTID